jgi:hypothetical protein
MRQNFKRQRRCIAEKENPTARWGFLIKSVTYRLAVLLTLLVLLAALAGPRRLLLLLLAGLLLSAALLLAALVLTILLLLARLLIWILIHCVLSSPTLVRSAISIARAPWQGTMRGGCIRSRSRARSILMKMCPELALVARVSRSHYGGANYGTLYAAVAAWSADSDSHFDLVVRRPALKMIHPKPARMISR